MSTAAHNENPWGDLLRRYKITVAYALTVLTAILGLVIYDARYQDARIITCVETETIRCTSPAPSDGEPEERTRR